MPAIKKISAINLERRDEIHNYGEMPVLTVASWKPLLCEPGCTPAIEVHTIRNTGEYTAPYYIACSADQLFDVVRHNDKGILKSLADNKLAADIELARKYERDAVNQVHFDSPSIREEKMSAGAAITGDLPISAPENERIDACDILYECRKLIIQRGEQNGYDNGRERSAAKIAEVFNALKGTSLSEKDVWDLLLVLKLVRAQTSTGNDSRRDMVSYAALGAECSENGVSK